MEQRNFWLEIVKGRNKGLVFKLSADQVTIGRRLAPKERKKDWILLDDPSLARIHAVFQWDEEKTMFRVTQKSANKTFLINGKPESEMLLCHMDRIQLGDVVVRVWDGPVDKNSEEYLNAESEASEEENAVEETLLLPVSQPYEEEVPYAAPPERTEEPPPASLYESRGTRILGASHAEGGGEPSVRPFQFFQSGDSASSRAEHFTETRMDPAYDVPQPTKILGRREEENKPAFRPLNLFARQQSDEDDFRPVDLLAGKKEFSSPRRTAAPEEDFQPPGPDDKKTPSPAESADSGGGLTFALEEDYSAKTSKLPDLSQMDAEVLSTLNLSSAKSSVSEPPAEKMQPPAEEPGEPMAEEKTPSGLLRSGKTPERKPAARFVKESRYSPFGGLFGSSQEKEGRIVRARREESQKTGFLSGLPGEKNALPDFETIKTFERPAPPSESVPLEPESAGAASLPEIPPPGFPGLKETQSAPFAFEGLSGGSSDPFAPVQEPPSDPFAAAAAEPEPAGKLPDIIFPDIDPASAMAGTAGFAAPVPAAAPSAPPEIPSPSPVPEREENADPFVTFVYTPGEEDFSGLPGIELVEPAAEEKVFSVEPEAAAREEVYPFSAIPEMTGGGIGETLSLPQQEKIPSGRLPAIEPEPVPAFSAEPAGPSLSLPSPAMPFSPAEEVSPVPPAAAVRTVKFELPAGKEAEPVRIPAEISPAADSDDDFSAPSFAPERPASASVREPVRPARPSDPKVSHLKNVLLDLENSPSESLPEEELQEDIWPITPVIQPSLQEPAPAASRPQPPPQPVVEFSPSPVSEEKAAVFSSPAPETFHSPEIEFEIPSEELLSEIVIASVDYNRTRPLSPEPPAPPPSAPELPVVAGPPPLLGGEVFLKDKQDKEREASRSFADRIKNLKNRSRIGFQAEEPSRPAQQILAKPSPVSPPAGSGSAKPASAPAGKTPAAAAPGAGFAPAKLHLPQSTGFQGKFPAVSLPQVQEKNAPAARRNAQPAVRPPAASVNPAVRQEGFFAGHASVQTPSVRRPAASGPAAGIPSISSWEIQFIKAPASLGGKVFDVKGTEFMIGRRAGLDLTIEDMQIAAEHIKLYFADGKLYMQKMDKMRPVIVNGNVVFSAVGRLLSDGDRIQLADSVVFEVKRK